MTTMNQISECGAKKRSQGRKALVKTQDAKELALPGRAKTTRETGRKPKLFEDQTATAFRIGKPQTTRHGPSYSRVHTSKRGAIFSSVLDTLKRMLGTGSDAIRSTSGRTSCSHPTRCKAIGTHRQQSAQGEPTRAQRKAHKNRGKRSNVGGRALRRHLSPEPQIPAGGTKTNAFRIL